MITAQVPDDPSNIVQSLLDHIAYAHYSKDVDAFMHVISEETSLIIEDGQIIRGYNAIENYVRQWYKLSSNIHVSFNLSECGRLDDKLWDVSSYCIDELRENDSRILEEGTHLVIWKWNNPRWVIWKDIYQVRKREYLPSDSSL